MSEHDDRQAIIDLTTAYCYALDDRRFEDLASVFTPDAVADYDPVVCHGIDEITAKVRGSIEFLDATAHMVANHRILVEGDKGSCECYLMAQHLRKGTPGGDLYMIAGRYRDEVVRTPQGWRIASRVLTRVWIQGNRAVVTR